MTGGDSFHGDEGDINEDSFQDDDDVTDPVSNSNTMAMPPSRRSKIEQLCTVTEHVAKMVALSCGGTEKEGAEGRDGGGRCSQTRPKPHVRIMTG